MSGGTRNVRILQIWFCSNFEFKNNVSSKIRYLNILRNVFYKRNQLYYIKRASFFVFVAGVVCPYSASATIDLNMIRHGAPETKSEKYTNASINV